MNSSQIACSNSFLCCSRKRILAFSTALLFLSPTPTALAREPGQVARPRADVSPWRSHPRSQYVNETYTRRGRWRSQLRPGMTAQRQTTQKFSEDLRKMMIPGLRTERLSEEGRDSLRQRVKAISITSKDKGEFSLPEPAASNESRSTRVITVGSVDKADKLRMDQHNQRFESMSDSQKSRMKDQMRRVRPLSIEERADVAQRDP